MLSMMILDLFNVEKKEAPKREKKKRGRKKKKEIGKKESGKKQSGKKAKSESSNFQVMILLYISLSTSFGLQVFSTSLEKR